MAELLSGGVDGVSAPLDSLSALAAAAGAGSTDSLEAGVRSILGKLLNMRCWTIWT